MRKLRQALGLAIIFFALTAFLTLFCAGCDVNIGKFAWSKMPEYIGYSALSVLLIAICLAVLWAMNWGAKQFEND